jgi:hypothetical protein
LTAFTVAVLGDVNVSYIFIASSVTMTSPASTFWHCVT